MNINVDSAEIHQFSQHAEQWWDINGPYKTLHAVNPVRLAYIQQYCTLQNPRVLDVGCGGGLLAEALARTGAQVCAIDMSMPALEAAREHAATQALNIDYRHLAVEQLAAKQPGYFDIVSCMEMLEHVPDPAAVVQACARLCKPHGLVFFSTLNRTPKAFFGAIVAAEYLVGLIPKGTHHYEKFIKPSELCRWSRAADLELKDIKGIHYNPLSHQARLSENISINYLLCMQRV